VTEPAGRAFLLDAVLAARARLTGAGRVVWVTTPVSQPPPGNATSWYWAEPDRADAWNEVQRKAAKRTGGEVLDFASWLLAQPAPETFRPDGTHLRGANAPIAAAWVRERLAD
jgi:hypothetical protein